MFNTSGNKYVIISVIGSHAGEDISRVFARKQKEIRDTTLSYWLVKSFKARTERVQALCKKAASENESVFCLFIDPASKNGSKPTTHSIEAEYISQDNIDWEKVPKGIKITGKIDQYSTALVFDEIDIMNRPLSFDLQGYVEFETKLPIKLQLGASTICCEQVSSSDTSPRFRNVVAIGKFHPSYAVWIK
jgi:hypothetical protein